MKIIKTSKNEVRKLIENKRELNDYLNSCIQPDDRLSKLCEFVDYYKNKADYGITPEVCIFPNDKNCLVIIPYDVLVEYCESKIL